MQLQQLGERPAPRRGRQQGQQALEDEDQAQGGQQGLAVHAQACVTACVNAPPPAPGAGP